MFGYTYVLYRTSFDIFFGYVWYCEFFVVFICMIILNACQIYRMTFICRTDKGFNKLVFFFGLPLHSFAKRWRHHYDFYRINQWQGEGVGDRGTLFALDCTNIERM